MRKITSPTRRHNHAAAWLLAGAGLLFVAACGGGGDSQPQKNAAGNVFRAEDCALVINDEALADFYDLADRVAAGEEVDVEAMGAVVARPVWDRWRRSFEPEHLTASRVGRALFIALRGRDALPERIRDKTAPSDLIGNFRVTLDQRERIEAFVEAFRTDELACGVFTVLADWIEPSAMPDTLRIDLMVGHPEIRLYEDHVMLDASLAWAAGRNQLVRFLASTVYRDVATIAGRDPDKAKGSGILLETLRLVRNEAVPAYLDDLIEVTFDPRHRLMANASPVPDQVCLQAQRTIISLDASLHHVLALPDAGDEDWTQLYRLFVGGRSIQPCGWYMARVIESRFGRDRLVAATRTVADFFAVYQEAALLSPAEPTTATGSVGWFLETAPPFSAENAAWLDRELKQRFP